ncbi:hypothetical protein AAES_28615 [Amazona aestiva]|uniref:Uncharacterized protein n=1 Tax=Amazona aestiva TaxID=12930 RepID=A0A0Q3SE51_AMAAE|nr:hypothetical protein AAES_28615 [Amazona aestiva]
MSTWWGMAYAYRALFNTIQHLQKENNATGSDGGVMVSAATPAPSTAATPPPGTSTVATQTSTVTGSTATPSTAATPPPATSTATTQTPVTSTAATQNTVIITAAKPEDQLVPIPVAPVLKRKSKKEVRKIKQDEETTYSPPGIASDQESSSHDGRRIRRGDFPISDLN